MSFGSGGFGGFGSNNNQTSSFGSGGFGNNTGSAFGSTNTNPAFGANTNSGTGNSLFGNTSGGFGNTGGGFGSSTTGGFGAKPTFGATTTSGGSLFGASTATAGPSTFGGFGASNTTSSPFGSGTSAFGAKPATSGFGTTSTGTSIFGGGASNTGAGAFGTGSTFGGTTNPGIGTNVGDPPGTQLVPFQPTVEKDANTTGAAQSSSFQNILFMDAYKKWSADELRLADYNQGRRYGNATGVGAFGVNSSFGTGGFGTNTQTTGGFGSGTTGTSLFGGNTNQSPGFGSSTANAGGFGTGGGLFGQNKGTTGNLFGSTTTQPAQTGGSVFGSGGFGNTSNTGTAFGTSSNTTGTGLFGSTSTSNKPGGFSFGTNTGNAGGFGSSGTTSAFGTPSNTATSTGGSLFGNTAQQSSGGLFGSNQPAAGTTGGFGTGGFGTQNQQSTTSSLFGNTQQKPAGSLFGGATGSGTTGGSLFGNTANTTTTPFGATSANQPGSGIFGAKPATTGTGVFGSGGSTQTGTAGTSLFGGLGTNNQAQQQQPAQSSLFGGLGQNQQKPAAFGTSLGTGGTLFGQQTQPQQGLFASSQQQPAPGSSIFGNSTAQSTPSLTASLADMSAYGSGSLFAGAGNNDVQNPGPLATPLSSAKKQPARSSILPIYKLTKPSTPKRGYGFSYSTYGSPSTPSSAASTPGGFGQSLLAGSINRGLSKSISTSSLRRSFNVDDSILAPGAFSASVGPRNHGSTGSVKRLVINRDIRSDLFSTPNKDRPALEPASSRKISKRVSFDTPGVASIEQGEQEDANSATPGGSAQDLGYLRPSKRATNGVNGSKTAVPADGTPEMEQVKGNELAIVHEESSPMPTPRPGARDTAEAGDYWMKPSKEEIKNMNRVQRQKVTNFTVGRDNIGHVRFRVPVDLDTIDLDEICEGLVQLHPRLCTVYPNPAKKPAMGKGLNVPAEITLEHSWPRGREKSAGRVNKHIERLKSLPDTNFVSFDPNTGVWVFTVEHFTTYGLDDDDDDYEEETDLEGTNVQTSVQSKPAPSPPQPRGLVTPDAVPDDTFDFKRGRRTVPGAFDSVDALEYEMEMPDHPVAVRPPSPSGSSDSASRDHAADNVQDQADLEMTFADEASPAMIAVKPPLAGAPHISQAAPPSETPAGIMRARMRAIKESTTPAGFEVTGGDDWMDILKKSVNSGKTRDRAALRSMHESNVKKTTGQSVVKEARVNRKAVSDGRGFATSIDLMNSLFGKDKTSAEESAPVVPQPAKSFIKWPYQKQHAKSTDEANMDPRERQFHNSFKPRWGQGNTLLVAKLRRPQPENRTSWKSRPKMTSPDYLQTSTGITSASREIWSIRLSPPLTASPFSGTWISQDGGASRHRSWIGTRPVTGRVPEIVKPDQLPSFKDILVDGSRETPSVAHEKLVWELASILFDPINLAEAGRVRRENLSKFWQKLVREKTAMAISEAQGNEDKAFACLAGHRIVDACKYLLDAKLYKLATLVPLVGTSDQARRDMAEQLEEWHDGDVLSEIETPIRAIYSLLAGKVSVCEGKTGVGSENRLDTLTFSDHFGLDWKQAFGLRLWYGIFNGEDIGAAIRSFKQDVEKGLVPQPVPWYLDGDAAQGEKENSPGVDDMLWSLLKLYAGQASLEDVLHPESCSPSHTDYSLCWQLGQLLWASGSASVTKASQAKADSLTTSFGVQLVESRSWLQAVGVLLHISDRGSRTRAVQDVIARFAMELAAQEASSPGGSSGSSPSSIKKLLELEQYHIPKPWIAEACALAYRYLGNRVDCSHPANFNLVVKEVRCLALTDRVQELQSVVVKKLDPLAILQWPPDKAMDRLVRYLCARPVNDGLSDLAALGVGSQAQRQQQQKRFDFDRYLTMLKRRYEEADEADVVTLAALSSLIAWVETKRLRVNSPN